MINKYIDALWTARDGKVVRIRDMSDEHLLNARNFMVQRWYQSFHCDRCQGTRFDPIFGESCISCEDDRETARKVIRRKIRELDWEMARRKAVERPDWAAWW